MNRLLIGLARFAVNVFSVLFIIAGTLVGYFGMADPYGQNPSGLVGGFGGFVISCILATILFAIPAILLEMHGQLRSIDNRLRALTQRGSEDHDLFR